MKRRVIWAIFLAVVLLVNVNVAMAKIQLTIESWRTEDAQVWNNSIIPAFEATHPDISVEFQPFKNTEYDTIVQTSLQGGVGPDIVQLRPYGAYQSLFEAGYFVPLDDKISALSAFPETARKALSGVNDGKTYGIPVNQIATLVYYNKELFDKYGYEEPQTWSEFIDILQGFKAKGLIPIAAGAKDGWTLSIMHSVIGPNVYGGDQFVKQLVSGDAQLTDEAYVASVAKLQELVPYFPPGFTGVSYSDSRTLFVNGMAAMFIGGSFELGTFAQMNPNLKLGAFMPPTDAGSGISSSWIGTGFGANAAGKNVDAAVEFLRFVASGQFGQLFADGLMQIPVAPGSTPSSPLVNEMYGLASSSSTPYLALVYLNGGIPSGKKLLEDGLQGMFLGKLTPQEVADNVAKGIAGWFNK